MSITPSADSRLRGCAGGPSCRQLDGEMDVLMAESTLVTVLGGFAARIDVAILPAASQEGMAARQHRGFVVGKCCWS
jgi:hypothetical protein